MDLRFLLVLGTISISCSHGWTPGTQYVYDYSGRIATGIREMKDQYAFIEIIGRVTIQSLNETTLIVQFSEGLTSHLSSYEGDPYLIKEEERVSRMNQFRKIQQLQHLERPFVIKHRSGSIDAIQLSSEDPLWAVNMKKAMATHLQLDVTGMRPFAGGPFHSQSSNLYAVHESGITGDCKVSIQVNKLAAWQSVPLLGDYKAICQNSSFYEIIKSKDFDRCTDNPFKHSANPPYYNCASLAGSNCRKAIQRMSTTRYFACGYWPQVQFLRIDNWGHLLAQPFGIDNKQITDAVVTNFQLKGQQTFNSTLNLPLQMEEFTSLSYIFPADVSQSSRMPDREETSNKVVALLRKVADQLMSSTDATDDVVEPLTNVRQILPDFPLEDLRHLWSIIKNQNSIVWDLFVDCLVTTGSNSTVLLLTELMESGAISATQAEWAMMSLGHYIKTPTFDLLRHLMDFIRSDTVQTSKILRQTAYKTMADIFNSACAPLAFRKYTSPTSGRYCTKDQFQLFQKDFVPLLVQELDRSEGVDRMFALANIGLLASEDIVAILLPHIRGNGSGDDVAYRARAILSLHGIFHKIPERVYPLLLALADNIAERPEVRMVAISILLNVQVPINVWQRVASRTWFEPNQQVRAFIYNMIVSYTRLSISTPAIIALAEMARSVLHLAKPSPRGYTWSTLDIQSSLLSQDLGVTAHTMFLRVADDNPVVVGHGWHYQMGPFTSDRMQVFLWNYNMEEAWNRFIAFLSGRPEAEPSKQSPRSSYLDEIWNQIKPARRPTDQRLGALHFHLLGSFNRFYDVEEMMNAFCEKNWHSDHVIPLNWLKFRQLAEIEINIPNELGLDTRYLAQLPILASVQGQVQWKSKSVSVESDAVAMVTWKLTGEIRTRLPFSGYDVSAGVDVRVAFNAPKNIQLQFNGRLDSKLNLGDQVNDLFYYHVKPYTAIRRITAWDVPISEDFQSIQTGRPFESQVHLPVSGVNLTLSTYSEHPHNDVNEWLSWINQWNVHSFSKISFVPLKLHQRQYRLRYSPEGTTVSSISTWFQYWKHHHSGSGSYNFKSSVPETSNIVPDAFKPVLERLFNNLSAGMAHVLDSGLAIQRMDGTRIEYSAILGLASDQFRDQMDLRVSKRFHEHSDDVVLCVSNSRNSDEFQHSEHIEIHFGNNCTESVSKIHLKAKVSADTSRKIPTVQDCENNLLLGFMGSHVCKVRDPNEIYNTYEVEADISRKVTKFALNPLRMVIIRYLNQFVTSYRLESNEADKFILHVVHDPLSESVSLRLLLPKETIVAENIRPMSPNFLTKLIPIVFPMKTGTNVMQEAASYATAGVSDSKCLVDSDRVVTFDGVAYRHVMNECNHVLITDCYKNNRFAVLARYVEGRPTIQVVLDGDRITIDPFGNIDVNGLMKSLESHDRFEVPGQNGPLVMIWTTGKSVKIDLLETGLQMTATESQVTISGSSKLRGRSCGLCGDFNQELDSEFKTASRCAVSSGTSMASSFQVSTVGHQCATPRQLKSEIEACRSVDKFVVTKFDL